MFTFHSNVASRRSFRCALLASTSALALSQTPRAAADQIVTCSASYAQTCSLETGDTGALFDYTLSEDGFLAYVVNDANLRATAGSQPIIIQIHATGSSGSTDGDDGDGEARGVDGGEVIITNNESMTLVGGGSGGSGVLAGINVEATGGNGVEPSHNGNDGGRGGDGGVVTIDNHGLIEIDRDAPGANQNAIFGIRVNSIGGDGGDMNGGAGDQAGGAGGDAKQVTITTYDGGRITLGSTTDALLPTANGARGISVHATGGEGGSENGNGGAGGTIDITTHGSIELNLDTSVRAASPSFSIAGVFARSTGGTGEASEDNSDPGGRGEEGRPITLINTGEIIVNAPYLTEAYTDGAFSAAMFALSEGGDGGASPNKNVGGAGGGAAVNTSGAVSKVQVSSEASSKIDTTGYGIMGMAALARGGDGGDGNGASNSAGGAGGRGADILLEAGEDMTLETRGDEAYGVVGQSIGGIGGGNAAVAGAGGAGGTITMTAGEGSKILTKGDFAGGVVLHSLGGGGGVGADFTSVLYGTGGDGGNGANAGEVDVTIAGSIETQGQHSHGVLAQSIGGGGGSGGIGAGLVLGLGGDGGEGGLGAAVTIQHSGDVETDDYGSNGIVAQSISGGGGAAGAAGGVLSIGGQGGASTGVDANSSSGVVSINSSGDVTTTDDASIGILAQSIGGGGGAGAGSDGIAAIGGSGGAASAGGKTSIFAVSGTISTDGAFSHGLVAQSIGGGGGTGGDVIDLSVGAGLGVGGSGGAAGYSLAACISTTYDACIEGNSPSNPSAAPADAGETHVTTSDDYSIAALAQSIGGGGGAGGSATGGGVLDIASLQLGGSGGASGDGWFAQIRWEDAYALTKGQNAPALMAQSIGGGGGAGGSSFAVGAEDVVALQIGGGGSAGGNGTSAEVDVIGGQARTRGANSPAAVAQVIGGGGGAGGAAQGMIADVGFGFAVSVGANGGVGGNAGGEDNGAIARISSGAELITGLDNNGVPENEASDSVALLLQSIGGGGGIGGASVADALTLAVPIDPEDPANAVSVSVTTAVGGSGGSGGNGGLVLAAISDDSSLVTGGAGSHGLLAQSIGGGGGAGGASQAMSASIGYAASASVDVSSSVGGSGGSGGHGGDVDITLGDTAYIQTFGANANAILAQSIGGGGGDGGVGSAATNAYGGGFSANVDIGIGGAGGSGSTGGDLTVATEAGTGIWTEGPGSRGVVAQSIGGGGGAGQGGTIGIGVSGELSGEGGGEGGGEEESQSYSGEVTVAIGAQGGSGGTGGALNLDMAGGIATSGDDADGLLAQSIGGGGGLGGSASNDTGDDDGLDFGDDDATSYDLELSVGARGGSGGVGGTVLLSFGGAIATEGDWSEGLVVQSIGGGGGVGGTSTAEGSEARANITLAVGGTGGTGGDGGEARVTVSSASSGTPSIATLGYGAHAVAVQSIGGGGGMGGDGSDQAAGDLTVGGADGGAGGAAGDARDAGFDVDAGGVMIATSGHDAYGVLVQAIGGGGGVAGAGNSEAAEDDSSHQLQVTVGGRGGASGDGGSVDIHLTDGSAVSTLGDRAFGLVAQSIGGGGGVGGASDTSSLLSVTVGGGGGASGDGDAVVLNLDAGSSVSTAGDGAHGAIAQSIGGGGGIGGDAAGPNYQFRGIPGRDAAAGESADVTVTAAGSIVTTGIRAHGLIAQSVSGGGGIQGGPEGVSYGSQAGDAPTAQYSGRVSVQVAQSGSIQASGDGAIGLLAQSDGGVQLGAIDVDVAGLVRGGSGANAVGVMIIDGATPSVTVEAGGVVGLSGDAAGYALRYLAAGAKSEGAYITTQVYGLLAGDIRFENGDGSGGAAGALYVEPGGSWTGIDRSYSDVQNSGSIDLVAEPDDDASASSISMVSAKGQTRAVPAAPSRRGIGQAHLTGDFVQTASGTLRVTGDFEARRIDLLKVDGTAHLGGTLLIEPVTIAPDSQVTVVSAEGGLRGRFDEVSSMLFDFAQSRVDGELTIEAVDSHFADPSLGLDAQQARAARYLDTVFEAGGGEFGAFFAGQERLARIDTAAYAQSLSIFAPGATLAAAAANFDRARSRLDAALGCEASGAGAGGERVVAGSGRCVRMLGAVERRDQDGDASGAFGYDGVVWTTGLAGQATVAPGWTVGGALGYEGADYSGDVGTSAEGGTGFLSAGARHEFGAWGLSASLAGSWGEFDLKRRLSTATANAETEVWSLAGRVHADWTHPLPHGWLRPSLDLDVVHSAASGYTEQGAGALNLALSDSDETAFMATPALEIGGETPLTLSSTLRGWVRIGATFSTIDGYGASGRLASASPSLGGFASVVAVPQTAARLNAGLAIMETDSVSMEAVYDGAFADGYSAHGASLRLTVRF